MKELSPYKVKMRKIGSPAEGYLTPADGKTLPISANRIFWTYFTPERVTRGRHAHKKTTIVLFALTGKVTVYTETQSGKKKTFVLNRPDIGLVIPPMVWHIQRYSHTAVQIALASRPYDEKEYVRDYRKFRT